MNASMTANAVNETNLDASSGWETIPDSRLVTVQCVRQRFSPTNPAQASWQKWLPSHSCFCGGLAVRHRKKRLETVPSLPMALSISFSPAWRSSSSCLVDDLALASRHARNVVCGVRRSISSDVFGLVETQGLTGGGFCSDRGRTFVQFLGANQPQNWRGHEGGEQRHDDHHRKQRR